MTRAFVTGNPVKHSKSPLLHGFWLEAHDIQGSYEAIELDQNQFASFLKTLEKQGFKGGNITIPYKEAAFQLVDLTDDAADKIGAVNTVWLEKGKLCGSNTDAYGFASNLDDYCAQWRDGAKAVILGAGGAARAVLYSLMQAGYTQVSIVNRTFQRASGLAENFGPKCRAHEWSELQSLLPDCDLLVNTTSLGMDGNSDNSEMFLPDLSVMKDNTIVTDIVYTPLITPILSGASARGLATVDGLGMLLHQAVPGFEKWFGERPAVTDALRNHILKDLT